MACKPGGGVEGGGGVGGVKRGSGTVYGDICTMIHLDLLMQFKKCNASVCFGARNYLDPLF